MELQNYPFIISIIFFPYLAALAVLKYYLHAPRLYALPLLIIYLVGFAGVQFFENSLYYSVILLPMILIGFGLLDKYEIEDGPKFSYFRGKINMFILLIIPAIVSAGVVEIFFPNFR